MSADEQPEPVRAGTGDFLVAGHSNMFAMGAPYNYAGPPALLPAAVGSRMGHFVMDEWKGGRKPPYWDYLVANAENRRIVLVFNGNQYLASFLLPPTPMIDLYDREYRDEALQTSATIVPRAQLKKFFGPTVEELETIVQRVKGAGCESVAVCATPPPRPDNRAMGIVARKIPHFRNEAASRGIDLDGEDPAFTPPLVLRKLWGIIQEMMREIADRNGVEFIDTPPEARDARGFLVEKYWGGDPMHGNRPYGLRMLERAVLR